MDGGWGSDPGEGVLWEWDGEGNIMWGGSKQDVEGLRGG